MEIKIDTKKDTPEDIQKMIEFLTKFIEAGGSVKTMDMPTSEGMMGMFGDDNDSTHIIEESEEWTKILTKDNIEGWVINLYIEK